MTITISLSEEHENFVKSQVETGRFASPDEVVNQGLEKLMEEARLRDEKLADLKRELQIGLDAIERGETVSHAEVFAEIRRMHEARTRK